MLGLYGNEDLDCSLLKPRKLGALIACRKLRILSRSGLCCMLQNLCVP